MGSVQISKREQADCLYFHHVNYLKLQPIYGRREGIIRHYILDWVPPVCGLLLLHKQSQMSRLMTSKAAMVGSSITSTVPGTLYFLPASVKGHFCKKNSMPINLEGYKESLGVALSISVTNLN